MPSMRDRIRERDRLNFVGRERELAILDEVLDGERAQRVVHLSGPGGIGKSALLRELARRAEECGFSVVWVDGRDVPPFPSAIEEALAAVPADAPVLLIFDSYELISSLDSHLRDRVLPDLADSTVVVFASRQSPSRAWDEQGWDELHVHLVVEPLGAAPARALLARRGVSDAAVADEVIRRSGGSPLALVVATETGLDNTLAGLVARLIGDESAPEHHRSLSVAALARVTTPELLADVLGDGDPHAGYKWLAERSFSEPLADGVALHALVAEALRQQLRIRDPVGEGALRRRIADVLHRRALAGQQGMSQELQHLIVDHTVRWGYSAAIGDRYRVDRVRAGDAEQIGAIMHAVGFDEWWATTRVFFDQHPDHAGVARDRDGRVGGYYVAVTPASAPPAAERDVLLGPWLHHARHELVSNSVVMWREAVDLTGESGEVTSLLGAGGLVASGVHNPRYVYLPISVNVPAAAEFSERLNGRHIRELDVVAFGQHLECHMVDFGPGGLLGVQRDWVYRETGAVPPGNQVDDIDPAALVRYLRDPAALATGPMWLGTTPAERLATLRLRVRDALAVFGSRPDDQLARAIIEHALLEASESHEAIARRLHVSRSAYFRRLHAASVRVGDEVVSAARRSA